MIAQRLLRMPLGPSPIAACRRFSLSSRALTGPWSAPTSAKLSPYIIIAHDAPDALETRLSVRDEHLRGIKEGYKAGRITFGGALLSKDHREAGEGNEKANSIVGSVLLVMAESEEEAQKVVEKDIYSTSGVFDRITVWPFLPATLVTSDTVKEASEKATASLEALRETEANKWKEGAMKSLEWLRKGGAGTQIT